MSATLPNILGLGAVIAVAWANGFVICNLIHFVRGKR